MTSVDTQQKTWVVFPNFGDTWVEVIADYVTINDHGHLEFTDVERDEAGRVESVNTVGIIRHWERVFDDDSYGGVHNDTN